MACVFTSYVLLYLLSSCYKWSFLATDINFYWILTSFYCDQSKGTCHLLHVASYAMYIICYMMFKIGRESLCASGWFALKSSPCATLCRPRCAHGFFINIERTWHIIDSERDPELVSFMMFSLKWLVLMISLSHICMRLLTHHVPCAAFKSLYKAAFTRDATGSATAARQPRCKYRNIGIQQECLHGDTLHAADTRLLRARVAIEVWTYNCRAAHAVVSSCLSFPWRKPTPKNADTWIIWRSRARLLPTM